MVNVVSAKPDLSGFAAKAELDYGNFNSMKVKGMLNLPIGETLGARVAGFYLKRDGFTEDLFDCNNIDGEDLVIDWQEAGGPTEQEPSCKGFGMSLLRQAIPYEFEGEADLTFDEKGFRASYRLPIINIVHQSDAAEVKPVVVSEVSATKKPLKHARALIVEDSYLLAAEHSSILSDLGFLEVDCASS